MKHSLLVTATDMPTVKPFYFEHICIKQKFLCLSAGTAVFLVQFKRAFQLFLAG